MKVFARIESLILGNGLNDALKRAKDYINAGADGIMIHSKSKSPNEVFSFCKKYNNFKNRKHGVSILIEKCNYLNFDKFFYIFF